MFLGTSLLNLDTKGRIAIPTKYRDALSLQSDGRGLILTRHPDGCLLLFPRPVWEKDFLPKIKETPITIKRIFLGSATEVEMDASGRILISQELRIVAGFTREIMLSGMDEYFELWDPEKSKKHEEEGLATESTIELLNSLNF